MRVLLVFCFLAGVAQAISVKRSLSEFRAYILYQSNNYERALEIYTELFRESQTCKSAYNLANTYYKLGIFASALKFYKQALDLPCKQEFKTQAFYAKIYHNLGNSFFMLSDLPQSIQAYKYALKLHPTSQSKNNLAYIQDMAANKGSFAKIIKKQKIQALSRPSKNSVELFMPNLEDLHKDLKPNDKNLEYKNLQHW
ncbi:MAG: tetratricopeptide repeat protein [Helicobacter sp.]|nr:tetratricopeptide repeat protein [Helicobacter sp.]MDD7568069.1 tetratricopeptide repeat protein [Helicobacter sp.]MDY5741267.1 tetratricopeptide repeat protein [Helicobacter sp.]